jgi:hypothetical protein
MVFLGTLQNCLRLDRHPTRTVETAEMSDILACCATENRRFRDYLDYMERGANVPDELAIPAFKSWLTKERDRNDQLQTLFVSGAPATEQQYRGFQNLFDSISIVNLEPDIRRVRRVAAGGNRRFQAYLTDTLPFLRRIPSMPGVREKVLTLAVTEPAENHLPRVLKHFLEQPVPLFGSSILEKKVASLGQPLMPTVMA